MDDREGVLRVALLGAGWVAHTVWLPALAADPAFTVAGVWDADDAAAARTSELCAGAAVLDGPHEVRPGRFDLAVIALPNVLHASVAAQVLKQGLPVFVEKPVCISSEDARALIDAQDAGGASLYSWSAARHRADVRAFAELLPSLGPVRHLGLSWVRASGIPQRGGWYTDRRLSGGGALMDLGWHLMDLGFDLLADPRVRLVSGAVTGDHLVAGGREARWRGDAPDDASDDAPDTENGREPGRRSAAAPPAVEDTARAFLLTDAGTSVMVEARWASHAALDETVLTAEGPLGVATLHTTFGFSPNRVAQPSLTVLRDGVAENAALPPQTVGVEYAALVSELERRLRAGAEGDAQRANDIVSVIEHVYALSDGEAIDLLARPALPANAERAV